MRPANLSLGTEMKQQSSSDTNNGIYDFKYTSALTTMATRPELREIMTITTPGDYRVTLQYSATNFEGSTQFGFSDNTQSFSFPFIVYGNQSVGDSTGSNVCRGVTVLPEMAFIPMTSTNKVLDYYSGGSGFSWNFTVSQNNAVTIVTPLVAASFVEGPPVTVELEVSLYGIKYV